MSMLTLFESRYTLKGRYNIGVGKTASMSMLTLFESRFTMKGMYNIGNVGKTASISCNPLGSEFIHFYKIKSCFTYIHNVQHFPTATLSMGQKLHNCAITEASYYPTRFKAPAQHWYDQKTKMFTDLHITYMV